MAPQGVGPRSTVEPRISEIEACTTPLDASSQTDSIPLSRFWLRVLPYGLALFFACWGLRNIGKTDLTEIDSARHAMNGAFLHDLVGSHKLAHPIAFNRYYYGRLPALSMPYHPPLFPLIESLFFMAFGVNLVAARICVAAFVAVSVVLLYQLISATHRSTVPAAVCTGLLFSLGLSQALSGEVMLEFPAMAFVLLSIFLVREVDRFYVLGSTLLAGAAAACAVWTKQNVFLGLMPFIHLALAGKRPSLRTLTVWIPSAFVGASAAGLLLLDNAAWLAASHSSISQLSSLFKLNWTGTNHTWPRLAFADLFASHLEFYADGLLQTFGVLPCLIAAVAISLCLAVRRWRAKYLALTRMYFAWIVSVFVILFAIQPQDIRYAFFAYPPLVVVGVSALVLILSEWIPERRLSYLLAILGVLWAAVHFQSPQFLRGPSDAARAVVTGNAQRVLYCGRTNGSFIFAVRTLDPSLQTVVIRGDKLPPELFQAARFEEFAARYGIKRIVLEQTPVPVSWDLLLMQPSASMRLERDIPLVSSTAANNGRLRIYRFINPDPNPRSTITLPNRIMGRDVQLHF